MSIIFFGARSNAPPDAWTASTGGTSLLDHMDAEIRVVTNTIFICNGASNEEGGTNTDPRIFSKCLLEMYENCEAGLGKPWSPNFGICLTLRADPNESVSIMLQMPDFTESTGALDAGLIENDDFQETQKPTNKLAQKELQQAKQNELFLRQQNESETWQTTIATATNKEFNCESVEQVSHQMTNNFQSMAGKSRERLPSLKEFRPLGEHSAAVLVQQMRARFQRVKKQS